MVSPHRSQLVSALRWEAKDFEGRPSLTDVKRKRSNDGRLTGDPKWVDGKFGDALEFDGASSYVDCGDGESLDIPTGGSVTMCAWVNSKIGSTAQKGARYRKVRCSLLLEV